MRAKEGDAHAALSQFQKAIRPQAGGGGSGASSASVTHRGR